MFQLWEEQNKKILCFSFALKPRLIWANVSLILHCDAIWKIFLHVSISFFSSKFQTHIFEFVYIHNAFHDINTYIPPFTSTHNTVKSNKAKTLATYSLLSDWSAD